MKLLLALVAGFATFETANAGVVGQGLYDGHYYEVYNDAKTGFEAFAFASFQTGHCGKQGYLATITSSGENQFIKSILHGQKAWFGLTDKQQEGVFVWANGEVSGFRNWARGEPNDYGQGEDCVQIGWNSAGEWNDNACDGRHGRFGFVVEYDCSTAPLTCDGPTGYWWGDPHMVTFDGLRFDCQGQGEFTVVKSLDSPLMVQGRFMIGAGHGLGGQHNYPVQVTRATAFNTGEVGVPTIQVEVPDAIDEGCPYTFYVDGNKVDDIFTQGTGTNKVIVSQGSRRVVIFRYPETGTRIEVNVALSRGNGCNMAVQVCLPQRRFEGERIIGMLGSPDGNRNNDWMTSDDGSLITVSNDRLFKDAYDYCTEQWCIDQVEDSLFTYSGARDFDYFNHCENAYDDGGLQDAINGLPESIRTICSASDDESGCLMDAAVGGEEDALNAIETVTTLDTIRLAPPPNEPEVNDVGEVTSVAPAPTEAPSASHAPTVAATNGGVFGDPHIKTWTGEKYDFHGICDLVMIQNPDFANELGMDIHVRTKKTKQWSYIAAAVVRIGSETFEVVGEGNLYWINGFENGNLESLSGYKVSHKVINGYQEEFTITLDEESKEAIVIKTFKEMVRVNVENPSTANFASSVGLLGSFGRGMKVGRDRSVVIEDNNEFGLEWQVLASEAMLFHNVEGPQAPAKCELPSTSSVRRRLEESSITLQEAEIACSWVDADDFDACVFDVLALEDKDVAGAY